MIFRKHGRPYLRLLLLVPVVVAFGLALVTAPAADLGLDGGLSLGLTQLPFSDELDLLAHDVHPPLFYVLLRFWIRLVGTTPFAAKSLTILAGTLGVAVLVGWVRALSGNRAAFVAGAIVAVSPALLEMNATLREFSLIAPTVLLFCWIYTSRRKSTLLTLLAGAAAIWTSYFAAAILAAAALDALLTGARRRSLAAIVAACASIAPWVAFIVARGFLATASSDGPRQGSAVVDPATAIPAQVFTSLRYIFAGRDLPPGDLWPAYAAGAAAVVAMVWINLRSAQRPKTDISVLRLLGVGAALALGLALGVNAAWTHEVMGIRYLVPAIPLLAALIGVLVARCTRSTAGLLALASPFVVVGALGTDALLSRPALPPDFWSPRTVVQYLDEHVRPNDVIVFASAEHVGYYLALSRAPRQWRLVTTSPDYLSGDVYARAETTLRPLFAERRTLWTVFHHQNMGMAGSIRLVDWLGANGYGLPTVKLPDSDIAETLVQPGATGPREIAAAFEGDVTLARAAFPESIEPGGVLPVELNWIATSRQERGLTVFVHLVDEEGRKFSQHDGVPVNGRAPLPTWKLEAPVVDRHALVLPDDIPSGRYWLAVGLYDSAGRLPLVGGGDSVRLGPVMVAR